MDPWGALKTQVSLYTVHVYKTISMDKDSYFYIIIMAMYTNGVKHCRRVSESL